MPTRTNSHVDERERPVCGQQPAHLLHQHRHMPPVRCVVFVSHCQIHRRSQTKLREKFRVQYFFLGGPKYLAESLPVPKLKMILHRRERHLAIQFCEIAKVRRNQNPPLPIDGHLMRSADKESFERLQPRIEPWLASQIRVERVTLAGPEPRQASVCVVAGISDINPIVIVALENFAKSGPE